MAILLLVALSMATAISAAGSRRTDALGIMKLPITAVQSNETLVRRGEINSPLANPEYGTIYVISIEIGTPPQPVSIQIDTGSSDLWVDPTCSTSGSVAFCESYPIYDPHSSSTALDTGYSTELAYGKGECFVEYLLDTVKLGGINIEQQQFGWAYSSDSLPTGIMGISWGIELIGYYNIIDQLALQGITNSRAFSLDLRSVDDPSGSIIFGGIDTMKYTGALEKRAIISATEAPDGDRYWIYMSSVGNTMPGAAPKIYTSPTYNQAVFLDSGGTLSRLPANLVLAMLADFPGYVNQGNGLYTVPCSFRNQAGTLNFGFGNTVIHVPYHEFIWVAGSFCVFGATATAAGDYDWVLGDTFLRAAYVVYDQDNRNLLLANAANCGTNLVPIGSGANAVPSITGACRTTSTSASITSSSTSTSKATTSSTIPSKSSSSLSTSSKTTSSSTSSTSSKASSKTSTSTSSSASKTSSSMSKTSSASKTSIISSTFSSSSSRSSTISTTSTSKTSSSSKSFTTTTSKSSSTLTTSSKLGSKASTSATAVPTNPVINGYAYVGCFVDSTNPHSLTKIVSNSSMSIELCISAARGSNPPYAYAGVEYGKECWAATTSPAAATPTSGPKACTVVCAGNAHESCGGRGQFNLWTLPTNNI